MLHSHSELIHPNLPKLVHLVFSVALDTLPNVRQASYALIKDLISQQLTSAVIQPFFPIIVAQLSCGLTYIDEKVQFDSLKLLDLYIQYHPGLLAVHIGKLLPLMMNLLSRHKAVHLLLKSESKALKRKRDAFKVQVAALDNDPSSKLLNVDSRLRILSMISKLLATVLESLGSNTSSVHASPLTIIDLFSDYQAFLHVMDTLSTLALESWVECIPAHVFSTKNPTVQHVMLMSKLVEVLSLMVKFVLAVQACKSNSSFLKKDQLTELYQKIANGISTYVVRYFPFSIADTRKEQIGQLQYSTNFTFCHLLMSLRKVSCAMKGDQNGKLTFLATQYLSNFEVKAMKRLSSSHQFLLECTKVIIEMIPILCEISNERMDDKVCLVGVFKFLNDFFNFCHPQSSSKHLLMKCLSDVFVQEVAERGLAGGR